MKAKTCRYCQRLAVLLRCGMAGYPYYRDYGPVWICVPCQAWVGCHPGTENPLGGLANAELRKAKQAAHAVFDPIWRNAVEDGNRGKARRKAYRWLAGSLGIPEKQCHIGYMDVDQCMRTVEACKARSDPGAAPPILEPGETPWITFPTPSAKTSSLPA